MSGDALKTTVYGDYFLFKPLVVGGRSEVWLGYRFFHPGVAKFVAVKRSLSGSGRALITEGTTAQLLKHRNIVTCYDFGLVTTGGSATGYLAMDYISGKNLAQLQQKRTDRKDPVVPLEVSVEIAALTARGLVYLERYRNPCTLRKEPVIHRDISPSNIMISYQGEIKILDFGIAQHGARHLLPAGKPSYMSPEQVSGRKLDSRSDLYSLGIVFWELLTGRKLFPGKADPAGRIPVDQEPILPPAELNPDVPEDLNAICMGCLHRDPEKRYRSTAEFSSALRVWQERYSRRSEKELANYMTALFSRDYVGELKQLEQAESAIRRNSIKIVSVRNSATNLMYYEEKTGQKRSKNDSFVLSDDHVFRQDAETVTDAVI